jgi:hypothetical protein
MKFPELPGQRARTERVRRSGVLGTPQFDEAIIVGGLWFGAFEAFGAFAVLGAQNAKNPALYLFAGFFIVSGWLLIWTMVPVILEHSRIKRGDSSHGSL